MIQFNLLPDVKLEYVKAKRAKHLVVLVSVVLASLAVGVMMVLFFGVNVVQKRHLNNLSKDITEKSDQLKQEKDIDKILTVQNQLNNLNKLHDAKPAAERIGDYLEKVTPHDVAISTLSVDFGVNTLKFDGKATSVKSVNQMIDTMKFAEYKLTEKGEDGKSTTTTGSAFSSVVLASFDRADGEEKMPVTYEITANFDPLIFNVTKKISLVIPASKITTQSVTERPTPLFQPTSTSKPEDQ